MTDANETRIGELGKWDVILSDELGCQLTTWTQFPSSLSTSIATGSMFTVTAKDNIEILSFEFESFSSNEEVEVDIFTLIEGENYLDATSNPDAWTRLSQTTAFKSPDEGDGFFMIAPRADMQNSIPLTTGEARSFYITLQTGDDLRLLQSTAEKRLLTGQEFYSDSMIRTDVGIGMRSGGFGDSIVMDRAFQGRIHYRSLQDCQDFAVTSQFFVPLAVHASTGSDDFLLALKEAFQEIMGEEAKWVRRNELHGLELLRIIPESSPTAYDDCAVIGFEGGCIVYNSTLTFKHFQTVSSEEIEYELVSSIEASNLFVDSAKTSDSPEMVYVGERILRRFYEITLSGVPPNTVLGSIQQEYISDTTHDFLRSFSSELPYLVEIIHQRALQGRRHLRDHRQLQSQDLVLGTYIYGIGEDTEEFFVAIEDAFRHNEELYTAKLQREQYRPGAINEYVDLGFVFSYLSRTSVYSNETVAVIEENTTLNWYKDMPIWMITVAAVSGVIILGCLIVAYRRCCKPFCCCENYEKKTLADTRISPQPQAPREIRQDGPGNRKDLSVSTGQNGRLIPFKSVRWNPRFKSKPSNQSNLGTTSSWHQPSTRLRRNASVPHLPSSGSNALKNNPVHSNQSNLGTGSPWHQPSTKPRRNARLPPASSSGSNAFKKNSIHSNQSNLGTRSTKPRRNASLPPAPISGSHALKKSSVHSKQSNLGTTPLWHQPSTRPRRNASLTPSPSSGSNALKNNPVRSSGFTGEKGWQKKRSKSVDRAKNTLNHSTHPSGSNGKASHMSRSKSLDRAAIENSSRSPGLNGKKGQKKTLVRTKSKSVDASKRISNIDDSVRPSRSKGVKGTKNVDRPKGAKETRKSKKSKKKANVKGFLGSPS